MKTYNLSKVRRSALNTVPIVILLTTLIGMGCSDQGSYPVSITPQFDLSFSTTSLNFGPVTVDQSSMLPITVTNNADNPITITQIESDHQDDDIFTTDFNNDFDTVIAAGEQFGVNVTFSPEEALSYSANLIFSLADDGSSSYTLSLSGTGIIGDIFWADVYPIFQQNCIDCHGASGGYSLATYNDALSGGRIIPNDPDNSLLLKRLTGSIEPQMPLGGSQLPDEDIELIRTWIALGAEEN